MYKITLKIKTILKKALLYRQDKTTEKLNKRTDDIHLVSFPKSGNTWVSFIIGNIMVDYCDKDIKVNFNNIHKIVPDGVSKNTPSNLNFPPLPIITKTHSKYNKEFRNSIYIIRDPRDVMVSYYHFLKDGRNKKIGNFSDFIRSDIGIIDWCKHTKSWTHKYNVIITYENLKNNPNKEIGKIMSLLNINLNKTTIEKAIKLSSFGNMKKIEMNDSSKWKSRHHLNKVFSFVRKGNTGDWKNYFSTEDIIFYKKMIRKNNLKQFAEKNNYYN